MGTPPFNNRGSGAFSTPGVDTPSKSGDFVSAATSPVVSFQLKNVPPPSAQYISATDRLALTAANGDGGVTQILVTGRQLRADDGQVTPFNFTMPIANGRLATTQLFDLAEGYLLDLQVLTVTGTQRGRCFVQIRIVRGQPSNFTEYAQLISDYACRIHNPKWPNGQYIASTEGPGMIRSITGSIPAAGANVSETVPLNARWKLKALRVQLTTAAAVANRQVRFVVDDGVNSFFVAYASAVQAAGAVQNYTFQAAGPAAVTVAQDSSVPGPGELILFSGWRIRTATDLLQAADQFTAPQYSVEEWIEL